MNSNPLFFLSFYSLNASFFSENGTNIYKKPPIYKQGAEHLKLVIDVSVRQTLELLTVFLFCAQTCRPLRSLRGNTSRI